MDRFGPDGVLITSFSRAAAAELAGRDLPVSHDRIGTLHSHCWHALNGPQIAEANVAEWNKDNPELPITPAKKGKTNAEDSGDESETDQRGDELLQELNRHRGMMMPAAARFLWTDSLRDFEKRWTEYKLANGLTDFADLIENCLRDVPFAPRRPSVIFADEAQDLNKMQLTLVRKWGERANFFVVAGDDDQTIYAFTGATPEAMLDPEIPDDHKIILKQSYRVPRQVHGFAEALIHKVTRRQAKEYFPRPVDGEVKRLRRDNYLLTELDILKTAVEHLECGQSVMFLASCAYMLQSLVAVLRKNGVPFHNPYRRNNGFWNPLRVGKRTSTAGRVLALLVGHPDFGDGHRAWTNDDLALWAEVLRSKGVLRTGVKTAKLKTGVGADAVSMKRLDELFDPEALESMVAAWEGTYRDLLSWWRERLNTDIKKRAVFPALIAEKRGPQALAETPRAIVGTIHSVKGGEADVVYLFPDLSQAGAAQYASMGAARDAAIRQFYVGATRTREKLYLCSSVGKAIKL